MTNTDEWIVQLAIEGETIEGNIVLFCKSEVEAEKQAHDFLPELFNNMGIDADFTYMIHHV